MRLREVLRKIVLKVIIPKPPTWMRIMIMLCPSRLKSGVSTVMRPVTQTALVAVKRASIYRSLPAANTPGIERKSDPIRMTEIKNEKIRILSLAIRSLNARTSGVE
jgi:hypothetical protein